MRGSLSQVVVKVNLILQNAPIKISELKNNNIWSSVVNRGQDSDRGRGAPIKPGPGLATENLPGPGNLPFCRGRGSIANSSHMLKHKLDDNLYYFRNII